MKSLMSVNSFQTFVGQILLMVIALPFGIHLMSHPFAVYTSSVVYSGFPENCMEMKKKNCAGGGKEARVQNLSM